MLIINITAAKFNQAMLSFGLRIFRLPDGLFLSRWSRATTQATVWQTTSEMYFISLWVSLSLSRSRGTNQRFTTDPPPGNAVSRLPFFQPVGGSTSSEIRRRQQPGKQVSRCRTFVVPVGWRRRVLDRVGSGEAREKGGV